MESIMTNTVNGVLTITLNRPDKYNSFNRDMALRLQKALDAAREDEYIRCIVLTGAGKAFCAGQDLNEVIDPDGPEIIKIVDEHYNPLIKRLRYIEKPIIAAVNGVAAGAGANIALACDVVIARTSATFVQAFSKIGLIPDSGGTFILPRLIGWQKAMAITIFGDKISAEEAEKMGMIYKAVDDEMFEDTIVALSTRLAQMPTAGIGLTKRAFNSSFSNDLDKQLVIEEQLQFAASQTADYKEGVSAFLEKRKPIFSGK